MSLVRVCSLLRELRDTGPGTTFELAAALGVPYDSLYHVLRTLLAEGLVVSERRPTGEFRSSPITWSLAPIGTPQRTPYIRKGRREARQNHHDDAHPHAD